MQQKGTNHPRLPVSRRGLFSILPAGLAACIGCAVPDLCEAQTAPRTRERGPSEKSGMTWEEVFRFTYRDNYIPTLKVLQKQIGNERFISMLEQGLSEAAVAGMVGNRAPNRDFATWVKGMRSVLVQHALMYSVIEDSPRAFEIRVAECLWAKIFREEDAADIGYAAICHPDYATASAFNPKIKLIRSKTLMQGHDCCNLRYIVEA